MIMLIFMSMPMHFSASAQRKCKTALRCCCLLCCQTKSKSPSKTAQSLGSSLEGRRPLPTKEGTRGFGLRDLYGTACGFVPGTLVHSLTGHLSNQLGRKSPERSLLQLCRLYLFTLARPASRLRRMVAYASLPARALQILCAALCVWP